MPIVKRAEKFINRLGAAILGLATGSMLILSALMHYFIDPALQKIFGVIWFIATAVALIVILARVSRGFKCPDCKGSVGPLLDTDGKPGTPLLRHCASCDVLWQIGTESDEKGNEGQIPLIAADHRRVHQLRRVRARMPERSDLPRQGNLRDRPQKMH